MQTRKNRAQGSVWFDLEGLDDGGDMNVSAFFINQHHLQWV
jgi:hypothetical protein